MGALAYVNALCALVQEGGVNTEKRVVLLLNDCKHFVIMCLHPAIHVYSGEPTATLQSQPIALDIVTFKKNIAK